MAEGRSVWRMIFNNFRNSLKLLPPKGKLVGKDTLGNRYFEAPLNVHSRRKSVPRWFEPEKKDDWQQSIPAEWEAWLRGRRNDPPTEEEILKNLTVSKIKQIKGDIIEAKNPKRDTNAKGFPTLKDLEREPGEFSDKDK